MISPALRACALLLLLTLAACGSSADTSTGDPTPEATADATPSPTEAGQSPPDQAAPTANLTDGCVDGYSEGVDYFPDKAEVTAASNFTVTYHDTYKVVEVSLPDAAEPLRYVLVQCGTPAPALEGDLADAVTVAVPVESIITLTTTNLPHFDELDAVDRLVGVGTGAFVTTPSVVERIQAGELPDYGDAEGSADLERVVATAPDLLVFDGFGEPVLDQVSRYAEAGIAPVVNVDFNERTPLGRAEWLKFTALFLNREAAANRRYGEIASAYEDITTRAAALEERPRVLVNEPYEGTWFAPGGQSFVARAIADAGGEYVFADDDQAGALSLDIETVLDAAGDADVWLQAGSVKGTIEDLLATDPRFAEFDAIETGEVYAYDAATTEQGGNPFFELAYTRADLYLADLFEMLHPDDSDHELIFFGRVPRGGSARR